MKPLGEVKEHFWLVQRMARATGADLDAAQDCGELKVEDWAAMVTRCRGCAGPESCRDWLDTAERAEADPQPAPGICMNRAVFARLGTAQDRKETVTC